MDSSSNIYEKNRISYIVAQRRYNYNRPTKYVYCKTPDSFYIIVGLIGMYVGVYMIIYSIYKVTDLK